MLKFQLHYVVDYAIMNKRVLEVAINEFFERTELDHQRDNIEAISSLFNEWLIFDFKLPSGQTYVTDYFSKNPDGFDNGLMDELKQIIETQHFDMFELQSLKRGEWMKVYGLLSGETYMVHERSGSQNAPFKGSFWGRVAKVNNQHLLVGSNPVFFPMTSTERSKKVYLEDKPDRLSPKDVLPFLLFRERSPSILDRKQMTVDELAKRRKSIGKRFNDLKKKYDFNASFEELIDFTYNEAYESNFGDYIIDVIKLGVPEDIVFDSYSLFDDVWNFFPHKKLHGKSPYEMYKQTYD